MAILDEDRETRQTQEAEGSGDTLVWGGLSDAERRERARSAFWVGLTALHRHRWRVTFITVLVAVVSVVVSLMLPKWYAATTTVLPPEGGGGGLGSLLGDLSPIASSLLGSGGGDYSRYLAILGSRSMQDTLIHRFDLVRVYELQDHPDPMRETGRRLMKNIDIVVSMEDESMSVTVYDKDPRRASQIANFLIDELNRRNEILALDGASRFRKYVEDRYREIELGMDSARAEMTAFQEQYGVVELPSMAQGLVEAAASQQAEIARVRIQYQALLSELGPENSQVIAARRALETAEQSQADLLEGREAVMPIAMSRLPEAAGNYAKIYQDVLVYQALMENARPLLEQARFDEERERVAVQVLDRAVPPARKARPKRAVIVLGTTASTFALALLLAVLWEAYLRRRTALSETFARARALS